VSLTNEQKKKLTEQAAAMGQTWAKNWFKREAGAGAVPRAIMVTEEELAVCVGSAIRGFLELLAASGKLVS
jgi:hypothetical protein